MASKIEVKLDTSKEIYEAFKCKQNDDLILIANIYENGAAKDLTNCSIVVQAKKADNTYIIQNTDINKLDKKFEANLVKDFTRVAGETLIEIVLVEGGKQNTTFSFILEVDASVIKGAEKSKDLITSLEKMQEAVIEMGKISDETKELINNSGVASKEEINKVNTQLAEKANENEVRKKQTPITLNDADETMLKAIQGGGSTSFTLESIPRDYSVSAKKTDFIKNNIIYEMKTISHIVQTTGTYKYVEIPIYDYSIGDTFTLSLEGVKNASSDLVMTLQGFNSSNEQLCVINIKKTNLKGTVKIPANVTKLVLRYFLSADISISEGTVVVYTNVLLVKGSELKIELDEKLKKSIYNDNFVAPENTSFIKSGKNKFNRNEVLLNGQFITGTGSISTQSLFDTSHWIELSVGENYALSNKGETSAYNFLYLCFYSKKSLSDGFVKRIDTSSLSDPKSYSFIAESPYCLVSYRNDLDTKIQLERGSIQTEYERFKYILNDSFVTNDSIDYSIFDQAYIKNSELVVNSDHVNSSGVVAKYTGVDLGENAITVKCKCKFIGHSTVALISEPNGIRKVEDVTMKSVHVTYNSLGFVNIGYFKDKILTNVEKINFKPLDVTGNTIYELGYTVESDGITVILPDGTTQKVLSVEFQNANGKYIIWEHYSTGVTETIFNRPIFLEFYAVGESDNPISDKFLRQNGAIGISPTGHVYVQFRNV